RLRVGIDEERLRHWHPSFWSLFQAPLQFVLDHAHSGKEWMIADALGCFQQDALLDAGSQGTGEDALESIARVDDQTGVDVAPMGFEIRIHPGKGAWHRSSSGGAKCLGNVPAKVRLLHSPEPLDQATAHRHPVVVSLE